MILIVDLSYQITTTTKNTNNMTTEQLKTKKITLATLKSFINKNEVYIKMESSFDGMSDMIEYDKNAKYMPAQKTDNNVKNTLGLNGLWLVGSSRNYFRYFEDENFYGIDVTNCCGSSLIAVKK